MTRFLHRFVAELAGQRAQDSPALVEAQLRLRLRLEYFVYDAEGGRTDLFRPRDKLLRRHSLICSVRGRHVLFESGLLSFGPIADVACDTRVSMEDLDDGVGDTNVDQFAHQAIGHRVVMLADTDVIILRHPER